MRFKMAGWRETMSLWNGKYDAAYIMRECMRLEREYFIKRMKKYHDFSCVKYIVIKRGNRYMKTKLNNNVKENDK